MTEKPTQQRVNFAGMLAERLSALAAQVRGAAAGKGD